MPLAWFEALKQPNGEPFGADSLSRYGYLPNPASPTPGLPVGFTVNGSGNSTMVGMTRAACHTRQIVSGGVAYRIDGGPAIVDFQSFLADLDTAVATVLGSDADFDGLCRCRARPLAHAGAQAALKTAVEAWFLRYDTLIKNALPTPPWGWASRRGGDDLQPPDRSRSWSAAQSSYRREHPAGAALVRYPSCGTHRSRTRRNGRASPQRQRDPGLAPQPR